MEYPLVAYCCYEGVCILCEVLLNGHKVGCVFVDTTGLYYKFSCECVLSDNAIYRLYAGDGYTSVKLGVCVPENGKFVLNTRVPKKTFGEIPIKFWVESNACDEIQVVSGMEFTQLDKLDTARLKKSNEQQYYILISSPTGQ